MTRHDLESDALCFGQWDTAKDLRDEWGSAAAWDGTILWAFYKEENYSGQAYLLGLSPAGVPVFASEAHCSCNGLERFDPDEVSIKQLEMINLDPDEVGADAFKAWSALLDTLKLLHHATA